MRFILAIALYIAAFVCFYGATNLAPDMQWPNTQIEYIAANMLIIGAILKTIGLAVFVRI